MKVRCLALNADQGPHFPMLEQHGFTPLPANRNVNFHQSDILIEQLQGCVGVIAGTEPYTRRVIESSPELRVIARIGVGFDAVDLAACDDRGVVVTTTPGVNHHAVAEHAIAMLMALGRGFPDRDRYVREGSWKRYSTPRIEGSTLGLIGLGRIGTAVARRALGLGMRVIAYDPGLDDDAIRKMEIEPRELDDLYGQSDYVSLHLPVTEETHHLINRETLARMKPGAVLINTARGALVDEAALCEALQDGHLRGAGLDVFEVEPLPSDSPLLKLDHVLLSGHLAGLDRESQRDTLTMAAQTIIRLQQGEWPGEVIQNLHNCQDWSWAR
ncbi:phosphoglycerate dehydrogenase [Rubinisphaera margarita]|uniref:phosphoglycerate dehydrogenase n=1 Tax=Rubinisphaera margarita TaxID=2909586 RepID=UPI001EE88A22|nr:phosphoglycerate dehydrogenase [Rubinisphaera margarita]MCG6154456.1 phosphoglycerate dehydrogenase [Rubinisphaera margarita]